MKQITQFFWNVRVRLQALNICLNLLHLKCMKHGECNNFYVTAVCVNNVNIDTVNSNLFQFKIHCSSKEICIAARNEVQIKSSLLLKVL